MRSQALAALLVVVGLLAPFFFGPTDLYLSLASSLGTFTLFAVAFAFLTFRQLARVLLRLGLRHPGGRLGAGGEG